MAANYNYSTHRKGVRRLIRIIDKVVGFQNDSSLQSTKRTTQLIDRDSENPNLMAEIQYT